MAISEIELMLQGHGLLTAQIFYRMPDHRNILQTFLWQEYDQAPEFPRLRRFLDFWQRNLDGPLHSVVYTHQRLIRPGEWRKVDGEFTLH
ncbi:MAG: Usg family protein [Paracoccaceae bacterium]|nr:MAG: aspartate-semialdehyde dehydrogenase [Alphaproteobacteria bacterium]GIX12971.1 MAG: Usg family protein [Paracoccaceae bacterium]